MVMACALLRLRVYHACSTCLRVLRCALRWRWEYGERCACSWRLSKTTGSRAWPEGGGHSRSLRWAHACRMGRYYPTQAHSRDAGYPYFYDTEKDNPGLLCGGLVSGPYARNAPTDGPVRTGTDKYENDRRRWQASEAAIDYTSSLVCTLMSYATMPDSLFTSCPARSPFTGRGI